MWQLILKANKSGFKSKDEFSFTPSDNRGEARQVIGGLLEMDTQALKLTIDAIKATKISGIPEAIRLFEQYELEKEEFLEDKFLLVYDRDEERTKNNMDLLVKDLLPELYKSVSQRQRQRAKGKDFYIKRNTFDQRIKQLETGLESNEDVSGLINQLKNFLETDLSYATKRLNATQKEKLLGLFFNNMPKEITPTHIVKVDSEFVKVFKKVFKDWKFKNGQFMKTTLEDIKMDELIVLVKAEMGETKLGTKVDYTIDYPPIAEMLGKADKKQMETITAEKEKLRAVNVDIPEVRVYLNQFLSTPGVAQFKYKKLLIPSNIKGQKTNLSKLLDKSQRGRTVSLNQYINLILDESFDDVGMKNFFDRFISRLDASKGISDKRARNEFINVALNIVREGVDPTRLEEGILEQTTPESLKEIREVVETIDGINDVTSDTARKKKIVSALRENETVKSAFRNYKNTLIGAAELVTRKCTEPMKDFIEFLFGEYFIGDDSEYAPLEKMEKNEFIADFLDSIIDLNEDAETASEAFDSIDWNKKEQGEKVTYTIGDSSLNSQLNSFIDIIYEKYLTNYTKFKGNKYPNYDYETTPAARKTAQLDSKLDEATSDLAISEFNSLDNLQKRIANTIFDLISKKKTLEDYFGTTIRVNGSTPEFLDIIKVLYLVSIDVAPRNISSNFNKLIKDISVKMKEAHDDENFFSNRNELPMKREIQQMSRLVKQAVPAIKEGLKESIQNILDNIVENPNKYLGLTTTRRVGNKKTKVEMLVIDRLKNLGLIQDE
tara:strand:+ start:399 stop:2732 length:2334 start_codon:yes stop_codon:yes gene_type:complete